MRLQVPTSLSAAHGGLHQISQLVEERLKIEEEYSRQLEGWHASARTVPPEDPLFCLIKTLLDTMNEDLLNRRAGEASLRGKLVDINMAIETFDSIFDPIRNEEIALGGCEEHAEQARMDSKASYTEWMRKRDETSFRKTVLRQEYSTKNVDQADGVLRKRIDELNLARLSFKTRLSQASDSLHVRYQATVERITKFLSSFAEQQQSVAGVLNAGGAKLWHSADSMSSSTSAAQFLELFSNEAASMKAEKEIYCALHKQDDYLTTQHHHRILAFPISELSCPKECQLVISLLTALLPRSGGVLITTRNEAWISKTVDNWGINSVEDQQSIQSSTDGECRHLLLHVLLPTLPSMIKREEVSKYMLQLRPSGGLLGPAKNQDIDEMNLLAVASVRGKWQGEIIQVIHHWYSSNGWGLEWFYTSLARDWPWADFKILMRHYNDYVTLLSEVSVVRRPLEVTTEQE